ncbi:hypothetical protein Sango_0064000 [Sesamum angolense]|uniref:Uncharacterized protein n=1 Tax=Sesamum angolense TaxID=2727404 RepID=A0AAE2C5Z0_9LAMI|nr:hypothetical protein Sango_0064000 [Sesamum angolense]
MMLFLKGRMHVNDPSLSVFKGYGLSKAAEEYLSSHGLKNAIYSIDASDVQDDLFGQLIMCPFRQPNSTKEKSSGKNHLEKRPLVQGLWKTKTQNMAELCKVAKELKDQFLSFQICHVERAEGTMNDSAIPAVTNALEGIEGIIDLKVRVLEGIASVEQLLLYGSRKWQISLVIVNQSIQQKETPFRVSGGFGCPRYTLRKQTTIQATGVASNLVEAIQCSGFKLQTLNLSFLDDEDFS